MRARTPGILVCTWLMLAALGCAGEAPPRDSAPRSAGGERELATGSGGNQQASPAPDAPVEATEERSVPAADAAEPAYLAGITQVSPTRVTVTRAAWGMLLVELEDRSRPRVIPAEEGGAVVGMRIYGIRPRTPLAALGIHNGDLMRRVSGVPLTTFERFLEAQESLATATRVEVELTRRGAPMTITIEIVP